MSNKLKWLGTKSIRNVSNFFTQPEIARVTSRQLTIGSAIVLLFGWFVIVSAPARQSWEAAAGHGAEVAGKGGT